MEKAEEFIARKNKEFQREKSKQIKVKDIGRKGKHTFLREAWVFMPQYDNPEKVFVIEGLRWNKIDGESAHSGFSKEKVEYRFGYYIIGKIGNKKGKWTWGQYCPFIPIKDFDRLITLAKDKGVILA